MTPTEVIRAHRWSEGVRCPHCHANQITKQARDEHQRARQRYRCLECQQKFDDLTGTVFAGHHQSLRVNMPRCKKSGQAWSTALL
ncbi:transposase (plasmid) [Deinococcus radiomollis]|uniref:PaaD-like zinc ribbon domain-containing protein n=1 Tax=Deinococcus radiomollis TaxID=468916 RepID=UPI003891753A